MKVLFLYTELADYFLKCCDELSREGEVHIVRWPVNKEAPFKFTFSEKIKVYDKKDYEAEQLSALIKKIDPSIIVCSGWIDKDYLNVIKPYYGKIPTVLACDTHWRGSLKQMIAVIISRFFLLNKFTYAWVPGKPQQDYVSKLGFKKIYTRFYCCDLQKFNGIYSQNKTSRQSNFPKVFLYAGRYYDFKGITDLWEAFIELKNESKNDWELWCMGNGDIEPVKHPAIKHFGFVQPSELEGILNKSGVFVLPSRFEPWGVVVHEYAASGFPMLLSREVGAMSAFLEENKNGYSFPAGDKNSIKKVLKKIINLSEDELIKMGTKSHELAQKITPEEWTKVLKDIYADWNKK